MPAASLLRSAAVAVLLASASAGFASLEMHDSYECKGKPLFASPPITSPGCANIDGKVSIKVQVSEAGVVHMVGFPNLKCEYPPPAEKVNPLDPTAVAAALAAALRAAVAFYDLGTIPGNTCIPLSTGFALLTGARAMRIVVVTDGGVVGIIIGVLALIAIAYVFFMFKTGRGPYAPDSSWALYLTASKASMMAKIPVRAKPAPGSEAADTKAAGDGSFVAENPMQPTKPVEVVVDSAKDAGAAAPAAGTV